MSKGSSLYRFRFEVADVDRSFYEAVDLRLSMNASEAAPSLLTRALAYALNAGSGLELSAEGIADPDAPAMWRDDPRGGKELWIEIGSPSARRLHKASKASRRVLVYTYKNPAPLVDEIKSEGVHGMERIEIYAFDPEFLERLEARLDRANEWGVMHDNGALTVTVGADAEPGELTRVKL